MMIIEGIEKRKQTMEKIANIIIEKQKNMMNHLKIYK